MHDSNPLDDPNADPFAIAADAAARIAELTGVERHDVALTLGSGWGRAADLIGETTHSIAATEVPGFSKPALEGHVGTLRSVALPSVRAPSCRSTPVSSAILAAASAAMAKGSAFGSSSGLESCIPPL